MMREKAELHLEFKNVPYQYKHTAPIFISCNEVCALTENSEKLLAALFGSPLKA
jgi:hypothetical protein